MAVAERCLGVAIIVPPRSTAVPSETAASCCGQLAGGAAAIRAGGVCTRAAGGNVVRASQARKGVGPDPVVMGDITALLRASLVALRVPAGANAWQPARPALWRVADAAARIGQWLHATPGGEGTALGAFLPRIAPAGPERGLRCRAAVASTLLAGLELARDGGVLLDQDRPWTTIHARRALPGRWRRTHPRCTGRPSPGGTRQ